MAIKKTHSTHSKTDNTPGSGNGVLTTFIKVKVPQRYIKKNVSMNDGKD